MTYDDWSTSTVIRTPILMIVFVNMVSSAKLSGSFFIYKHCAASMIPQDNLLKAQATI